MESTVQTPSFKPDNDFFASLLRQYERDYRIDSQNPVRRARRDVRGIFETQRRQLQFYESALQTLSTNRYAGSLFSPEQATEGRLALISDALFVMRAKQIGAMSNAHRVTLEKAFGWKDDFVELQRQEYVQRANQDTACDQQFENSLDFRLGLATLARVTPYEEIARNYHDATQLQTSLLHRQMMLRFPSVEFKSVPTRLGYETLRSAQRAGLYNIPRSAESGDQVLNF